MKQLLVALYGLLAVMMPGLAWAEGVGGYSRGNAFIYFSAMAAVLIYGIHDVFHKKWLTWISAVVIPVTFYMLLPAK
ncbi:MAG: hypothetical protein C4293_00980 [Nitrospiraceae bacterium]